VSTDDTAASEHGADAETTQVPPDDTAASEHGADAETTEVPPPPPADEPGFAWSVDDDTDEMSTNRHGRLVWAGLAVLVVAITAALVLLVSTLFGRHAMNNGRPQAVPSPPVTTTVAAAPPPAPVALPPTATTPPPAPPAPSPYASLVGKWSGHHRGLTVSPDGTIELQIPDEPACPLCSLATMPPATIHIGLTACDAAPDGTPGCSGKFFGYVKDSSDPRVIPASVPAEVDVMNASDYSYMGYPPKTAPGRVMTISINGDHVGARNEGHQLGDPVPFCDQAADHTDVCGA
jgi:hypothetical protein